MSGESPQQNILNQGGPQVCNPVTATGTTMIPNSVVGSPGVDSAIGASAQLNPISNPIQASSNQGQLPSNQGQMTQNIGLNNFQQGLVQGQGPSPITSQKLRQQQQMMMLSSTSAQQNMGSNANHSPTGVMHRSASVPRINPSQQYNSSRSPTIYGHSQLPFSHPLQHQQQQQQLSGLTRSAMMGQGQGPGHISMLSGQAGQLSNFQSQFLSQQVRQKQPQIQSSQFQQLVSSGQPLQGMQIGLMSSLGTGTQNRMNGTLVYSQQRMAQGPLRSPPTPQQQALSSPQKIQTQNMSRVPSVGSLNSQLTGLSQGGQSALSSSLPHTPQWPKMQQSSLPLSASPSYQLQQHQRQQQAQLQQQTPPSPSQQQPTLSHPQQLSQQQNSSQLQQHQLQQAVQPQPISRMPSLTVQKPSTPTGSQPAIPTSSVALPAGSNNQGNEGSPQILGKRSIEDLVAQVDPTIKLDPDVIDLLLELAEEYYQSAEINAIAYAKHRKSTSVEEKDMLLHLKKNCRLSIPGYATKEFNKNKRMSFNEVHMERLAKIQKSMAAPQVESEAVVNNGTTGQLTGSSNSGLQVAKALQSSVPTVASSMGSPGVPKK
ncbi:hypothetical protein SUGI_0862370 [Cryptomeria japonica]|uniref:transcription initiation factor TFIID subunit 12b n=1 Tax=Cryptomeria japonica TaxID=3369 RepID=UPI00241494EC|nr:transcription initiation factor TFIID subunit 12b [Cryptomeria japonica]GLJ41670.1 hypothetical protein SUGI_0862370 [Cryptomeria japonica]